MGLWKGEKYMLSIEMKHLKIQTLVMIVYFNLFERS